MTRNTGTRKKVKIAVSIKMIPKTRACNFPYVVSVMARNVTTHQIRINVNVVLPEKKLIQKSGRIAVGIARFPTTRRSMSRISASPKARKNRP